ncbi:MAG: cobalamin-dependent protein [Candidatus Eisenbacteria bacterium]|nr:cobalamin-dependent protein [Candidatus Eisenbacteria bacterium]
MLNELITKYNEALIDTDRERALNVVRAALDDGISPEAIVFEVVLPAMDRMIMSVSEGFEANVAQHFITAQISNAVTNEMLERFTAPTETRGRIVIGNSQGDLHALGKRIVIGCLRARMIEVIDLGTNVPPEKFVSAAVKHDAPIIAISSMMVHTARGPNGALKVRELLHAHGLEDRIKIIVGGAPYRFDHTLWQTVKADGWAENAVAAARLVEDMLSEVAR